MSGDLCTVQSPHAESQVKGIFFTLINVKIEAIIEATRVLLSTIRCLWHLLNSSIETPTEKDHLPYCIHRQALLGLPPAVGPYTYVNIKYQGHLAKVYICEYKVYTIVHALGRLCRFD